MINTILFDLDGTLLPMDQEEFIKLYFKGLYTRFSGAYDFELFEKAIWKGTGAMYQNDGRYSNEDLFWAVFTKEMDVLRADIEDEFTDFYNKEFSIARGATKARPAITAFVHRLSENGYRLVAATNPLFPKTATRNRLRWAGFNPDDFCHITTYEHCHFCKPNLKYYEEILQTIGSRPEECVMIGNDNQEDMCVESLGIKGFLVTDCLINRDNADINCSWTGTWQELIDRHSRF